MADYNSLTDNLIEELPYSLEAEQSVLGCLLLEPSLMGTVLGFVKAESFHIKQHKSIFNIMIRMFSTGRPIDYVTVLDLSVTEGIFEDQQSGKMYLAQLMDTVPSTANVEYYCKIVQEKHYVRALINASRSILQDATEGSTDAKGLLDAAEQRIYDIRQGRNTTGLVKIDEIIVNTFDNLQKLSSEDREEYLGLPSGFSGIDAITTGLNKSDLILIAARPAMGKTSFALNIACNCAKKTSKAVAVFSLEMSSEQLVGRLLSSEGKIPSGSMRTGMLQSDEWTRLAVAAESLASTNLYLDDSAGITVAEMKAKVRRLPNLGLIVIDYLQLMSTGRKSDNRVQEISEITRNLKIMAKELNVPVITLSQLSRGPESRTDHRPMMSDLRESGSIEQDADIVMFLYRDAYYNPDSEEQNIAECIISKNRHGEAATVKLAWDGQYTSFSTLETHYND